MSQIEVMLIMAELGAYDHYVHITKIQDLAQKKFPQFSLYKYIGSRLSMMKRKGYVTNDGRGYWKILDDSVIRNRNIVT